MGLCYLQKWGIRTVDIRFEIVDQLGLYHVKNFVDLFDSILWGDAILHHHKAISCVANELADRHTQIERQLFKLVNGGDTTTLDVGDKAGADAALLAGGGGADPRSAQSCLTFCTKRSTFKGGHSSIKRIGQALQICAISSYFIDNAQYRAYDYIRN